jgi:hypothetical protein
MSTYKEYLGMFISEDGILNICYEQDDFGANYVEVPIGKIQRLVGEKALNDLCKVFTSEQDKSGEVMEELARKTDNQLGDKE